MKNLFQFRKKNFIFSFITFLGLMFLQSCRTESFEADKLAAENEASEFIMKTISVSKDNPLVANAHLEAITDSEGNQAAVDFNKVIHLQKANINSYTFKVLSNEPDAPFQNIVIMQFPNGVVIKKLVTFSLTDLEKQNLKKGLYVNLLGKATVQNFDGTLVQYANNGDSCFQEIAIDMPCSENKHWGASQAGDCTAKGYKSYTVYKYIDTCGSTGSVIDFPNAGDFPGDFTGGSSGGEGESTGGTNPYDPDIIYTSPNIPNKEFVNFVSTLPDDLKLALQHVDHIAFYWGMSNYFFANNQSQEAKNFIIWASQFMKDNWWITWEQFQNWFISSYSPEKLVSELQGYPCAQSIFQELPSLNNDIAQSMRDIFQNNENYNIIFRAKSGLGDIDGTTLSSVSHEFGTFKSIISLNDQVLQNATKEYILVTMYHEVIHAFLDYERFRLGNVAFNNEYPFIFVGYDYDANGMIVNRYTFDSQHQQLGAFLNHLESIISSYNPNLPIATVKALAKSGITTFTPQEKNLNDNERDTTLNNYLGTKCP